MNKITLFLAFLILVPCAKGQDIGWMMEQAPLVSMVLAKAFERGPAFSAKAEVSISGKADPEPTTAAGALESSGGNIRWDVKIGDIKSAQLSSSARALFRQINGEQFVLLTRVKEAENDLVLSRARAYIQQPLPGLRLSTTRSLGNESVDGQVCAKEKVSLRDSDGGIHEAIFWRAKELKRLPIQIQLSDGGETIRIRLANVRLRPVSLERFKIPAGLAKHESIEDLAQALFVDRMRKRMGLE